MMLWWHLRKAKSSNPQTRAAAAKKLGRSRKSRAIDMLSILSKDKDSLVRRTAVSAIGRSRHKRACEILVICLKDPEGLVRQAAAHALSDAGCRKCAGDLAAALAGSNDVVGAVRRALSELVDQAGIELLTRPLIQSPNPEVRKQVADLIGRICGGPMVSHHLKYAQGTQLPMAVKSLFIARRDDKEYQVQEEARKAIIGIISTTKWNQCESRSDLIPFFSDEIERGDSRVRLAALEIFEDIADDRAIRSLVLAISDADEDVRSRAILTLNRIDKTWQVKLIGLIASIDSDSESQLMAAKILEYSPSWKTLFTVEELSSIKHLKISW